MKDALYIKTRIADICAEPVYNDREMIQISQAKQNTLLWIYNAGNLRTEKELTYRINRLKEEIMGYELANVSGFPIKLLKTQVKEVENILYD